MKLSNNFSLKEFTNSATATRLGISNEPNTEQIGSLLYLTNTILQPLRLIYGSPIRINSGFRGVELNKLIGGAKNSQHLYGEASDIDTVNDNIKLFNIIKDLYDFDQLISEGLQDGQPQWLHVSTKINNNRNEILIMVRGKYYKYSEQLFKEFYK